MNQIIAQKKGTTKIENVFLCFLFPNQLLPLFIYLFIYFCFVFNLVSAFPSHTTHSVDIFPLSQPIFFFNTTYVSLHNQLQFLHTNPHFPSTNFKFPHTNPQSACCGRPLYSGRYEGTQRGGEAADLHE